VEDALGLRAGDVVIYCPESPRSKAAEVDVMVDGAVRSLTRHEQLVSEGRSTTDLTVGMLAAQRARTMGLWKLVVGVSGRALDSLGHSAGVLEDLLLSVFGFEGSRRNPETLGYDLADRIARLCQTSPLYGRASDLDSGLVGRRRGSESVRYFPNGVPWPSEYLLK
jgi:hypothetical protein